MNDNLVNRSDTIRGEESTVLIDENVAVFVHHLTVNSARIVTVAEIGQVLQSAVARN